MASIGLSALLVTNPVHVRYLSGFNGSNGAVWLSATTGEDRLVTDARYDERARADTIGLEVIVTHDLVGSLPGATRDHERMAIGFEADHLTWAAATAIQRRLKEQGVRAQPVEGLVQQLRSVKDAHEIESLRQACAVTVDAMAWLFERVGAGRTERQLALELERRFVDLGAESAAFPSIIATGRNGARPHHSPGDDEVAFGDLLTIDCGAVVDGYHADCTRTVAVGTVSATLAQWHEIVATAQQAGVRAAVTGVSASAVDDAARAVIRDAGYGDAFVHGTGHGVGLEIHEAPAVTAGSTATLRQGMVITVEPGIYVTGAGGVRIEDTLVVTDSGPDILTDLDRALIVV